MKYLLENPIYIAEKTLIIKDNPLLPTVGYVCSCKSIKTEKTIKYGRPKSGMKPLDLIIMASIVTRVSKDGPSDKAIIRKMISLSQLMETSK